MKTAYHAALELIEAKESFVVASVVDTEGSTPRKSGAWMIARKNGEFYGTVGGGRLEHEVEKLMPGVFETKKAHTYAFKLNQNAKDGLDMACGGDATVLIEYVDALNPGDFLEAYKTVNKAVIFGCGHVGTALEPVLRHIGFSVTMVDDRPEYANTERFPQAAKVVVLESFENPLEGVEIDEDTYVVIMTRGHAGDYNVIRNVLGRDFKYLGMIGSRSKVAQTMKRLAEEGFTQEQIDRAHSPIGLKIGAETPEEIAISVAAEIIAVKAGKMA